MEIEQAYEIGLETAADLPQWERIPNRERILAKLISGIFSPPLMVTAGLLFIAQQLGEGAVGWVLFQIALGILVPVIYIVVQIQRGMITDFHMKVREQRILPMFISLICAGVSWAVMKVNGAPFALLTFGGIAILQSAFMLLITLKWKISGHSMTIAGMAVFLFGVFGITAAPMLLTIPLVAWARVRLNRHDRMQTLAGTFVGITFTALGLYFFYRICGGVNLVCQ